MKEARGPGAHARTRMHAAAGAPPVRHAVGGTRLLAGLLLLVWLGGLCAAVGVVFASTAQALSGPRLAVLVLAVGLSGLGLVRFWRRQRAAELAWDGAGWSLLEGGRERPLAGVEVRLDLQRALLLRADGVFAAGPGWLWAQADARDPARWHLLRCALYSRSPPSSLAASSETASG